MRECVLGKKTRENHAKCAKINRSVKVICKLLKNPHKQLPEVFLKKGFLRNFAKFTGKYLSLSLFFNKFAGSSQRRYSIKKVFLKLRKVHRKVPPSVPLLIKEVHSEHCQKCIQNPQKRNFFETKNGCSRSTSAFNFHKSPQKSECRSKTQTHFRQSRIQNLFKHQGWNI